MGWPQDSPASENALHRPTTDIAKEGLFNILQHQIDFEGYHTLDLFGGTGAISYELASRGATQLTIVEKDSQMSGFIKKNMAELGVENVRLVQLDVFRYLETCTQQFDFIFAGPPYALQTIDELPKIIIGKNLLATDGLFILEHTPRNHYEGYPGFVRQRNYGTTVFSFFEPTEQ